MVRKFPWARLFAQSYIWLLLLFMYLPVAVLIVFSFTDSSKLGVWNGFSFDLYRQLFANKAIMTAIGNTVIIALVSAVVATFLGTIGAIGVFESKERVRNTIEFVNEIPVVNPEIVIALSLTVMFVFVGDYIFRDFRFSFWTILAGHLVLSLPFVYLSVKPKLEQMDPSLYEAALDLGCTPHKALRLVIIPEVLPGVLSGFLLSLTLSLDDFIVTFFTRGAGLLSGQAKIETISTYVEAIIKKKPLPPDLRALCTLITLAVVLVVFGIAFYGSHRATGNRHQKARAKL